MVEREYKFKKNDYPREGKFLVIEIYHKWGNEYVSLNSTWATFVFNTLREAKAFIKKEALTQRLPKQYAIIKPYGIYSGRLTPTETRKKEYAIFAERRGSTTSAVMPARSPFDRVTVARTLWVSVYCGVIEAIDNQDAISKLKPNNAFKKSAHAFEIVNGKLKNSSLVKDFLSKYPHSGNAWEFKSDYKPYANNFKQINLTELMSDVSSKVLD